MESLHVNEIMTPGCHPAGIEYGTISSRVWSAQMMTSLKHVLSSLDHPDLSSLDTTTNDGKSRSLDDRDYVLSRPLPVIYSQLLDGFGQ